MEALERVYVSVKVSRAAGDTHRDQAAPFGATDRLLSRLHRQGRGEAFFLEREVLEHPGARWIVLGDPGSGKTTLLNHAVLHVLDTTDRLPIVLKISKLKGQGLKAWLEREHPAQASELKDAIDAGEAVVLLDGLDEAVDIEEAHRAARRVAAEVGRCPIILTSRPTSFTNPDPRCFAELRICPLSADAQEELLTKWIGDPLRAGDALTRMRRRPRLKRLAENPLLLTLAGRVLKDGQDIPDQRGDLYRQAVKILLRGSTDPERRSRRLESPDEALGVLGHVALHLHSREEQAYPLWRMREAVETDERIAGYVGRVGSCDDFFWQVADITGMLEPNSTLPGEAESYHFPHRTFREYLAATALEREIGRKGVGEVPADALLRAGVEDREVDVPPAEGMLGVVLADARENPGRWSEVLALCCGLLGSKTAELLVRRLAAEGRAELLQRVIAEAEGLDEQTIWAVLGLEQGGENWQARRDVIQDLPSLTGDLHVAMRLAWRLASKTTNGNDLWFTRQLLLDIARGKITGAAGEWLEADLKQDALEQAEAIVPSLRERLSDQHREATAWAQKHRVWIKPGTFQMGSPEDETYRLSNEGPQHTVTLTEGFWLMSVPITNRVYELLDKNHLSDRAFTDADDIAEHPVVNVTWYEAAIFAEWLDGALPTEAQWEYAARAGTTTPYWWGDEEDLSDHAWWLRNAKRRTHAINAPGHANPWELSDMLGNVWEWCRDGVRDYTTEAMTDPCHLRGDGEVLVSTLVDTAPHCVDNDGRFVDKVSSMAVRGGSWSYHPRLLRCALRYGHEPLDRFNFLGFRVVLRLSPERTDL